MEKSIKLVLMDLDGTLLSPSGVPRCAWDAAARARASGLHPSICTEQPGRGFAHEHAERLYPERIHIFESGAEIVWGHRENAKVLVLPLVDYHKLLELSRTHGIPFEVYPAEGGFSCETIHPNLLAHGRMLGFEAKPCNLDTVLGKIFRVRFVARLSPAWQTALEAVPAAPQVALHETTSPGILDVSFSSVTASGVSKRAASKWVAAQLGLNLNQCAMVGNGQNDLELTRAAPLAIVMGNAFQKGETARRLGGCFVGGVRALPRPGHDLCQADKGPTCAIFHDTIVS